MKKYTATVSFFNNYDMFISAMDNAVGLDNTTSRQFKVATYLRKLQSEMSLIPRHR